METSPYTVNCASAEQAKTLRQWFKEAVTGAGPRENQLIIELTENQAYGLDRDFGITATRVPSAAP